MKKWIVGSLLLFAVQAGFASEDPVVVSGPVPAVPSDVFPGYSNTFVLTLKNNVNQALPLSITGISLPLSRVTVANDCGNRLPPGPSTCNIAIAAAFTTNNVGTQSQAVEINYQGRAPIIETFSITVDPILAVTAGSPAALFVNDTGSITVMNVSPGITATNVAANFSGTALAGNVTQTNTCPTLAPGNSCTLNLKTANAAAAVPLTNFSIQGTNTEAEPASMSITALSAGQLLNGGVVACTTAAGGPENLIAATVDNSPAGGILWSPNNILTTATSMTNGQTNTTILVNTFGPGTGYAAGICDNYSIDSSGFSPCQSGTCYNNWYLPATSELSCVNSNSLVIGGFAYTTDYWTSTDDTASFAYDELFSNPPVPPFTPSPNLKTSLLNVRCVSKAGTGN